MLISKNDTSRIEEHIVHTEEVIGVKFPAQYRNFLLKYNGGETPETTCKIGKIKSDIEGFYGLGNAEINISELENIEYEKKKYFPIAYDAFGNLIFIGLKGIVEGQIFFNDHEKLFSMKLFAEDFNSFIKACKSRKIGETARKTVEEREAYLISRGYGHNVNDNLKKTWQKEYDKFKDYKQEKVVLK